VAGADRLAELRAVAERVAGSYGLEVFDLQFRREGIGWVLRIFIDRPAPPDGLAAGSPDTSRDSVSIEDCRRVSDDVGAILEVENLVDRAYTLEVSSPGLDRPLRNAADYRRFAGRLAKVVLNEALDGQRFYAGRLGGIEGDQVVLVERSGRVRRIPLSVIARGRLDVEF
jgi:ribosome maturation factor RimP